MNGRGMIQRLLLAVLLMVLSVATVSAQDDTSSITVEGATLQDEMTLVIPAATIAVDGWIVVHDSDASGNIVAPAIISEPVALKAGSHTNIEITLTDAKAGGDKLFPMLHIDAGTIGTYEFPGADTPVKNGEETVVVALTLAADETESETQTAASAINVNASTDLTGNTITIPGATIAQDGWIVVHDSDAEGNIIAPGIISEPVALKAGTTQNIVITLTNDITDNGHKVYPMLHIDAGVIGTYEFPGADAPVKNGDDVVVVSTTLNVTAAAAPTQMPTTGAASQSALLLFAASALVIGAGVLVARRNAA